MTWRPMTEHKFPWEHHNLLVAVFDKNDNPELVYVLRVRCAEHGALFVEDDGMLSIHEHGVIPIAWKVDDTPARDDFKWPPKLTDYLTEAQT